MWVVRCFGHIVKSMASDINTGKAPCSNTAAAVDCLSPLVAIRLCDSLETAQPMLNTTLAIHLTSKKVDAFASVTHRLIQGYRFRVGPYRFCGASNPTTHSILLWSYLILSDAHMVWVQLGDSPTLTELAFGGLPRIAKVPRADFTEEEVSPSVESCNHSRTKSLRMMTTFLISVMNKYVHINHVNHI